MRWRLIRRCLLFGLLGALTAVVVAWGLTIYCRLRPLDVSNGGVGVAVVGDVIARVVIYREPGLYTEQWTLVDTSKEGPTAVTGRQTAEEIRRIGGAASDARNLQGGWNSHDRVDGLASHPPAEALRNVGSDGSFIEYNWAGWPFPALKCFDRTDYDSGSPSGLAAAAERYMLRFVPPRVPPGSHAAYSGYIALPLQPRPGLLLNTIFYALLWAAILLAPRAIRRRIRRARGRCPRCGYALRDQPSPGCPECGEGRHPTQCAPGPRRA